MSITRNVIYSYFVCAISFGLIMGAFGYTAHELGKFNNQVVNNLVKNR